MSTVATTAPPSAVTVRRPNAQQIIELARPLLIKNREEFLKKSRATNARYYEWLKQTMGSRPDASLRLPDWKGAKLTKAPRLPAVSEPGGVIVLDGLRELQHTFTAPFINATCDSADLIAPSGEVEQDADADEQTGIFDLFVAMHRGDAPDTIPMYKECVTREASATILAGVYEFPDGLSLSPLEIHAHLKNEGMAALFPLGAGDPAPFHAGVANLYHTMSAFSVRPASNPLGFECVSSSHVSEYPFSASEFGGVGNTHPCNLTNTLRLKDGAVEPRGGVWIFVTAHLVLQVPKDFGWAIVDFSRYTNDMFGRGSVTLSDVEVFG